MRPSCEYFEAHELIEDVGEYRCEYCGGETNRAINIAASGEDCLRCVECFPPESGWYARCSAPGYLDCTDWQGPYPNAFRAIRDLLATYDIDLDGNSCDMLED